MNFTELNLTRPILRALEHEGYRHPSPIQTQAIPLLLEGKDLFGCAQTGTGKTAAFAIPILQTLYKQRQAGAPANTLQALVLTPTRELAAQVTQSFKAYGRYTRLRTAVVFGGVGQGPQVAALRAGVDILVATPGRLNDLIGQGLCDLSRISMFVLDEADRMLDMGFIHDVKRVIAQLPSDRQTLLFSATMPKEITTLAASILRDPVTVAVTPVSSTVDTVSQSVYFVDKANKGRLLIHLLADKAIVSALVFSRTKHGADRISRTLNKAGINAGAIHGDKSQGAREKALADFKAGRTRILVATDIAARGIDIDQLSHVINYDLPNEPETYVHRIGRTGRAGLDGIAISFCDFAEKAYLKDIQKLIGKEVAVVEEHPYPMQIFEVIPPQTRQRPPRADRAPRAERSPRAERPPRAERGPAVAEARDKAAAPRRKRRR
ncbi:DEAD/DEAH box helicase [Ruminococcaceae bacterium OttesenSCG-928-L11]|nr:DEAD/DEAH box helicase [Ruminococcaceae bacterium OttesenSCG-928-L11]